MLIADLTPAFPYTPLTAAELPAAAVSQAGKSIHDNLVYLFNLDSISQPPTATPGAFTPTFSPLF